MLAGKMKLKTFLVLAGVAGLTTVGGLVGWWSLREPPPEREPAADLALAQTPPSSAPEVAAVAERMEQGTVAADPPEEAGSMREVDRVVLSYQGRDLGSDKLKDVTQGKPFKVNVYQDAGKTSANRAKIDLDRDDKWDEKIDFGPDGVKRQVAPLDDEAYSETTWLEGGAWVAR